MKSKNFKNIESIHFEFCATPESLLLEFLDKGNNAFMNIEYTDEKCLKINFYCSDNHISIPYEKFVEGLSIMKKKAETI